MNIKLYEWRTADYVDVLVTDEPVLIVDGSQSWFEVDIRFPNGDGYYAQYDERALRWESGSGDV